MNSPSTNLAWHYAGAMDGCPHDPQFPLPGPSGFESSAVHVPALPSAVPQRSQNGDQLPNGGPQHAGTINGAMPAYPLSGSAVSDASLLLGLNNPYSNQSNANSSPSLPQYNSMAPSFQHSYAAPRHAEIGSYSTMQPFGDMMIESHDIDTVSYTHLTLPTKRIV